MDPYREYYLAYEESFELSNTVGVTDEQWKASCARTRAADEACAKAEAERSKSD